MLHSEISFSSGRLSKTFHKRKKILLTWAVRSLPDVPYSRSWSHGNKTIDHLLLEHSLCPSQKAQAMWLLYPRLQESEGNTFLNQLEVMLSRPPMHCTRREDEWGHSSESCFWGLVPEQPFDRSQGTASEFQTLWECAWLAYFQSAPLISRSRTRLERSWGRYW